MKFSNAFFLLFHFSASTQLTIIERQIFDFLGYMWAPILANFFQIIFVIFGFFGGYQFSAKYLITVSWSLGEAWNVFFFPYCFSCNDGRCKSGGRNQCCESWNRLKGQQSQSALLFFCYVHVSLLYATAIETNRWILACEMSVQTIKFNSNFILFGNCNVNIYGHPLFANIFWIIFDCISFDMRFFFWFAFGMNVTKLEAIMKMIFYFVLRLQW